MRALITLLLMMTNVCLWAGAVRVIGQPAPELTIDAIIQAPTGTTITLQALHGKAVVLDCWATWCGPCVEAIPHLNDLVDKTKDQPVQFIALTSEEPNAVRAFLEKNPLKAWVAADPDNSVAKDYRIPALPVAFLMDTSGTLRGLMEPGKITEDVVKRLIDGKPLTP